MAHDAMDIKEALSARVVRAQQPQTAQTCTAKDDPGNATMTGALDATKQEAK